MPNHLEAYINTYTGKKFYPFAPQGKDIAIEDIAHSLANQCRFNGHSIVFYSVAEHSVEVSHQVKKCNALWGLLHDAAETYLSDIVRPIKRFVTFYDADSYFHLWFKTAEEAILQKIGERFGCAWPMPEAVDVADLRMLMTERLQLFDDRQPAWGELDGVEPYDIKIRAFTPFMAERLFLERFEELSERV